MSNTVKHGCIAVWDSLKSHYVRMPLSEEELLAVSKEYSDLELPTLSGPLMGSTLSSRLPAILVPLFSIIRGHIQ